MANILGELLFALIRSIVAGWAYALWVKLATWLEPKIQRRWVKIAVGGLLGLAAFYDSDRDGAVGPLKTMKSVLTVALAIGALVSTVLLVMEQLTDYSTL